MKQKNKPQLCECGCGNLTNPGRKFIHGHNGRKPEAEPKLCECGCNEYANPGRRFIQGHQSLGREPANKGKRKSKPEPKLCECGCGKYARPGNRFIRGHSQKGLESKKQPKPLLCECGCGDYAKPGNRFIKGHNGRKPEQKNQLCECGCGEYTNPGRRFILGHQNRGRICSDKTRENLSISQSKRWEDVEQRERQSDNTLKQWEDELIREKMIKSRVEWWEDPIKHEMASAARQGIPYDEWEDFACKQLYCPDFNEECKESNREKYDRMCFLTGLPEENNVTSTGKYQKLSVHHVDMDKGQGCNDKKWKLVPLCMSWHSRVHNKLWESRIIWLLDNVWN